MSSASRGVEINLGRCDLRAGYSRAAAGRRITFGHLSLPSHSALYHHNDHHHTGPVLHAPSTELKQTSKRTIQSQMSTMTSTSTRPPSSVIRMAEYVTAFTSVPCGWRPISKRSPAQSARMVKRSRSRSTMRSRRVMKSSALNCARAVWRRAVAHTQPWSWSGAEQCQEASR
eukprot:5687518-Prymnesium_polylepis.1